MIITHNRSYNLYRPKLKTRAKDLRNNSTLSEVLLWNKLKGGQLFGHRFRRQKPIGEYIVDFYCPKLKLVIEIDGRTHDFKMEYDEIRQKFLENTGLRVLRINDAHVKRDIDNVIQVIVDFIDAK